MPGSAVAVSSIGFEVFGACVVDAITLLRYKHIAASRQRNNPEPAIERLAVRSSTCEVASVLDLKFTRKLTDGGVPKAHVCVCSGDAVWIRYLSGDSNGHE